MPKYVKATYIQKHFDISHSTLRRWAEQGKINVVHLPTNNQRLYDYEQLLEITGTKDNTNTTVDRKRICYARVSSSHQKEDLQRQVEYLKTQCPDSEIIQDIGSGLNWNRKGIQSLLDRVIEGTIEEIVVTDKDRLCRFGIELLQWLFQKFDCKLVVLRQTTDTSPELELSQDILSIVNYFAAKNNGMRSSQNRKIRNSQSKKNQIVSDHSRETNLDSVVRSDQVDVQ